jgi:hypothetical protein
MNLTTCHLRLRRPDDQLETAARTVQELVGRLSLREGRAASQIREQPGRLGRDAIAAPNDARGHALSGAVAEKRPIRDLVQSSG